MAFDPALRQIIAGFRNSDAWDEELDLKLVQALWPGVAGASLARNTSVVRMDGQRIVVRVPDETWQRQLRAVAPSLVRKLNEPWAGPPIRHIHFEYEDYSR